MTKVRDSWLFALFHQAHLRQSLLATEDFTHGRKQCICEYKGKVMLWHQFEDNQGLFRARRKKAYPFGLYYQGLDGLELFIDGRTSGNETRYVRRACHPNSQVSPPRAVAEALKRGRIVTDIWLRIGLPIYSI